MTVARPTAPRYEGRLLPRPDDELVDQGLGFDLATLVSRRGVLRGLGLGVVGLGLAACGSTATSSVSVAAASAEIPDETAGPYPGDGSNGPDVLQESGIVRQRHPVQRRQRERHRRGRHR